MQQVLVLIVAHLSVKCSEGLQQPSPDEEGPLRPGPGEQEHRAPWFSHSPLEAGDGGVTSADTSLQSEATAA